jgi:cytidine deaminase
MTDDIGKLKGLALDVMRKAYCPYSKFQVGCALVTEKGNIYTGCNVENASYGGTICAESNAIVHAVAEEGPSMKLRTLVIASTSEDPAPPCAICRQRIGEFGNPDTAIWLVNDKQAQISYTLSDLLPHPFVFSPEN